jgi:hypothetical protein
LWEPNGSDFLSPSLEEADLMRRVLPQKEFMSWFNRFMPIQSLKHLMILPVVSDRSDLQIVHLDGLSFSRSWCLKGIAAALPKNDPRRKMLMQSSFHHLSSALPHVVSGEYGVSTGWQVLRCMPSQIKNSNSIAVYFFFATTIQSQGLGSFSHFGGLINSVFQLYSIF